VAKFAKDPIYRTKVIVRKRLCCQKLYLLSFPQPIKLTATI